MNKQAETLPGNFRTTFEGDIYGYRAYMREQKRNRELKANTMMLFAVFMVFSLLLIIF